MSIEKAILSRMMTDAELMPQVGQRIYPNFVPQGVDLRDGPAVVYQLVSSTEDSTTEGAVGLLDSRWQFTCWAKNHALLVTVAQAVRDCWAYYAGSVAGVTIQGTQVLDQGDIQALSDVAEDLSRFGRYVEVLISYNA